MKPTILLMAQVEPYFTLIPELEKSCRVIRWQFGNDDWRRELDKIEGVYVYAHIRVDGPLMDTMPKLKVISNFGVGVDHIDLNAASERNIFVGNTPGVLDGATADMTFALLLAGARNITQGDRFARSSDFTSYDPSFMLGQEVHGSVLGIVGLGNIGYQVAKRALAFDMKVVYHNRTKNERAESELGVEYLSLNDLLQRADFVSLNMPLTSDSTRMIGRLELNLMKPSAVIVNAARGGVIDHDALLNHLNAGKLHAAALDVTEPEPLPRDHPLLKLENVIIAPHLGSATHQTRVSMVERSVKNLMAGLSGEPLPWRIA
ncbi:MAG: D-glycerate dehydrogenase [Candidatus Latescibacterota bacterium]|nr:D-glycerate dehydrogenase [Candidatus Latescibacterota bacterium]